MRIILRKSLLTTQQTTYRFGALGNSGYKSAKERGFPSGKGRKKPFSAESAIINAFGSRMPQVRILSLRPKKKRGSYAPSFPLGPLPGPVFAPQTESCFACGKCFTPTKTTEMGLPLFFCFKRIIQHLGTCRLPGCNPVNTGLSAYLTLRPIYVTILP